MRETSKKIGISQPWFFNTFPYNPTLLNQQIFITGFLNNYGILASDIYISEHRHLLTYHLTIFLSHKKHYSAIKPILKVLKPLLILKYNKNVCFNIRRSPSLYYDDKLLGSWLKVNIQKDTMKVRPLIKKILHKDKLKNKRLSMTCNMHLKKKKMNNAKHLFFSNILQGLSLKYFDKRVSTLKKRLVKNKKSLMFYNSQTFTPVVPKIKSFSPLRKVVKLDII